MYDEIRRFRSRLDAQETLLGVGVGLSDPAVTEALAASVDFFWIDTEHTHLSHESVLAHLIAARAGGAPALVRVPGSGVAHIKPLLDIGADGIIVPQVRCAQEVRDVVGACRYAPLGTRGFGPRRAGGYGRVAGSAEYFANANASVHVAVQIENREALADLDAIVAIEGLDSIVLGPFDLSIALGYPREITRPDVMSALQRIVTTARDAGKYVGTGLGADSELARQFIRMGVQWLQCGDDYGHMIRSTESLFADIRTATAVPTRPH